MKFHSAIGEVLDNIETRVNQELNWNVMWADQVRDDVRDIIDDELHPLPWEGDLKHEVKIELAEKIIAANIPLHMEGDELSRLDLRDMFIEVATANMA